MNRLKFQVLPLILLIFSLGGCGLSKADKEKAKLVGDSLARATTAVNDANQSYKTLVASGDYAELKRYDEREKWSGTLAEADQAIKHGRQIFDQDVAAIIKNNDSDDVAKLKGKLDQVELSIKEATTKAKVPRERVALISEAKASADKWAAKAEEELRQISERLKTSLTKHEAALKDHEPKKDEILKRFSPVQKTGRDATTALATVKAELAKGKNADWLLLADNCKLVAAATSTISEQASEYEKGIGELYQDYSKVLADMRADYFVTVGRTSWDESSDWSTEKEYDYKPRQVSEEVFDFFDDLADDGLVASYGGWGGLSTKIDQGKWNVLGIEPKENWPSSSHGDAEYYLVDTSPKYFHKYTFIKNEKESEGDWEEVSAGTFDSHWGNLGMALLSKPYGSFESEAVKEASPPGMAQVGNARYGTWKQDATGNSFWEWYGQYRFMSMLLGDGQPHYYRRSEWDDWNSNYRGRSKNYYGERDGEENRYGTASGAVRSSRRYNQGKFASQGGFKEVAREVKTAGSSGTNGRRADSSVRGSGPARRGGGPGGGGK